MCQLFGRWQAWTARLPPGLFTTQQRRSNTSTIDSMILPSLATRSPKNNTKCGRSTPTQFPPHVRLGQYLLPSSNAVQDPSRWLKAREKLQLLNSYGLCWLNQRWCLLIVVVSLLFAWGNYYISQTIQRCQHHISAQNFNRRQLWVIITDRSQLFSSVHTGR